MKEIELQVRDKKTSLTKSAIHIEPLNSERQIPFELLKLADPCLNRINSYLTTGMCFLALAKSEIVGVMVLDKIAQDAVEIKNLAVRKSSQGQGIGKMILRYSEEISRALGYKTLVIGTGNSSTAQLALYQKVGFEMERIEKDFFLIHYAEPIFENGIQCKHMVVLKKVL